MTREEDKVAQLLARYEAMGLAVDAALHTVGPDLVEHAIRDFGGVRKLAREIGLSPTYLSQVRRGRMTISRKSFLAIHAVLFINERT